LQDPFSKLPPEEQLKALTADLIRKLMVHHRENPKIAGAFMSDYSALIAKHYGAFPLTWGTMGAVILLHAAMASKAFLDNIKFSDMLHKELDPAASLAATLFDTFVSDADPGDNLSLIRSQQALGLLTTKTEGSA
jgi:hypothetical protein